MQKVDALQVIINTSAIIGIGLVLVKLERKGFLSPSKLKEATTKVNCLTAKLKFISPLSE
jgi:hypothetical protein